EVQSAVEVDKGVFAPHVPAQLLARDHLPGSPHEQRQDLQGLARQMDPASLPPQLAGLGLELEHREAKHGHGAHPTIASGAGLLRASTAWSRASGSSLRSDHTPPQRAGGLGGAPLAQPNDVKTRAPARGSCLPARGAGRASSLREARMSLI